MVKNISGLKRVADNVLISNNSISCKVDLKQPETIFTSVPYSFGWKVYGNGKLIDVTKTDIAFMSFDLDSGEHHIELVYRTPGLYIGTIVTAISVIIFIFLNKKRKNIEKIMVQK